MLIRSRLALLTLLAGAAMAGSAEAQTPAALQTQINKLAAAQLKMDSTLKRLEARLAKLETAAESDDKDARDEAEKAENEKQLSDLERRVGALERAPAPKGGNPASGSAGGSTVRAPFVVQDADGSVILRVTGGKTPRMMIGVEKGGQVELGTGSAGGGTLRVRDGSNADRVILIASEGFGQLRALSQSRSAVLSSNDEVHGASLALFVGDTPTARMRSGLEGYGAFQLTGPDGLEAVFAGSIKGGAGTVGIVRTGPKRRAGTMGPPSVIMGAN